MPRFDTDKETEEQKTASGFGFSSVRPDQLGATEYTLVSIVVDKTGSVEPFAKELLDVQKRVIASCKKSPRADNLLVRVTHFNNTVDEIHGFMLLEDINPDDYQEITPRGTTALFDATGSAIDATLQYAEQLTGQDFDVNAIVVVITDGMNNAGHTYDPAKIAGAIERIRQHEEIESILVILIGIKDPNVTNASWAAEAGTALARFKDDAKLDQYVDAGDATPQKLAKVEGFVSNSISSQSQSLGTGGPSQTLTF